MSNQSIAEDLAYVRDLAEAGQRAPLLGGRFLVWWGALTTLAYLAHYGIVQDMIGVGPSGLAVLWIGYAVIGLAGSFVLQATLSRGKPGAFSTGNRVSTLVWKSVGLMLGAFFMGAFVRAAMVQDYSAFLRSVPLVLGAYGVAQYVSGKMAENQVLIRAGQGAIAAIVPAVMTVGRPEIWPTAAIIVALTVLLPGILLMRKEPSVTV